MINDISYENYRRSEDIHGTVLYPAIMVAPVQYDILRDISIRENDIRSIFDPFHGSGTALYESCKLFPDAMIYGCDINPLANLITEVKLRGVNGNIATDIKKIKEFLNADKSDEIISFPYRDKWFRDDIAKALSKLKRAIEYIEDEQNRKYFWCMLCDIIRYYSNSRSSTYKLHIKEPNKIEGLKDNVINDFLKSIQENYTKYEAIHCANFTLFKQDIFTCLPYFADRHVDILITSPPYGDNNTTVPYGQFSSLALKWIDSKDLNLEGWELDTYSSIDNHSLANSHSEITLTIEQEDLISSYLQKIDEKKRKKVRQFFHDYFRCIDSFTQITEHYIILTVANRTVDRVKIDLADITGKYLLSKNFFKYQTLSRRIVNKRTPPKTSRVKNKPVDSMKKEYVLIYSAHQLLE